MRISHQSKQYTQTIIQSITQDPHLTQSIAAPNFHNSHKIPLSNHAHIHHSHTYKFFSSTLKLGFVAKRERERERVADRDDGNPLCSTSISILA
ncbi:hypothetical protein PRUPE_8G057400 [Prunus persica]|uniref:Uncharacterized protein n=1 Tax=Prunus persica TaxID=3760 RepID=A0A251MTT1_PRUPE|nr:hypothetical protein PRUPE_8G057400 [Prunus persica]